MTGRYQRMLKTRQGQASGANKPEARPPVDSSSTVDPRPDLAPDHISWVQLLTNAKAMFSGTVFGTLHGIRCSGAQLARTTTGGLKLMRGENSEQEWQDVRERWLAPIREELVQLLKISSIGVVDDEVKLPEGAFEQQSLKNAWLK